MRPERLDVLIYGHDGRGLGHASRSIGIGLALRRLYPELKILFVSGCSFSQEMIGEGGLDWLKLPSYRTRVVDGKSKGIAGNSNYSDRELGLLRGRELVNCVTLYRPRVVLVDHTPQGKHKELIDALKASTSGGNGENTQWLLGVRGVVGEVAQARSELGAELFRKYYSGLLWYGDSEVLGQQHCGLLYQHYGTEPVECGYVLRLAEYCRENRVLSVAEKKYAATVSIPWLGEHTREFVQHLATAIKTMDSSLGMWRIFLSMGDNSNKTSKLLSLFDGVSNCKVEPPSSHYVEALIHSKCAVIYGGYNSLMDVLHSGAPSLVVLRDMQDAEQQIHLQSLQSVLGDSLTPVAESEVTAGQLQRLLLEKMRTNSLSPHIINVAGAERAAQYIRSFLTSPGKRHKKPK